MMFDDSRAGRKWVDPRGIGSLQAGMKCMLCVLPRGGIPRVHRVCESKTRKFLARVTRRTCHLGALEE